MGKNWCFDEFVIVSDMYAKDYHKCKFKIDSDGKFKPTKGTTSTMTNFYQSISEALKEKGYSRSSNSVQKKEPDFVEWTRVYKHAIEKSGGESVVGRRASFIPIKDADKHEPQCEVIMENFFSAFGNSPKCEPQVLDMSKGKVKLVKFTKPKTTEEVHNKLYETLESITSSIEQDNSASQNTNAALTTESNELDDLLKKSQIYAQFKSAGMPHEQAFELAKLNNK